MRLPGKFFIAAWQRQSARWSEAVCPLHVYTLHPVAFVHFDPLPAALMWMLMRMTFGARCPVWTGHDEEMAFTLLTRSDREMSSSCGTGGTDGKVSSGMVMLLSLAFLMRRKTVVLAIPRNSAISRTDLPCF